MNCMKWITTFLLILFLVTPNVFAQNNVTNSDPQIVHPMHPSLIIVIGILSTMFSLTFLILACAKFCQTDMENITHQGPNGILRSRSRFSGIDKKTIESLPFFRFSSLKGSKEGLECVVCLSKFDDSEVLRLLPKCRHAFHMNCIDKWLEGHSSCPLCRYKFDAADLTNFTYTNSLRYTQNSSHLEEGLNNIELFIRREHDHSSRSLRFNMGSGLLKFGTKEEGLIEDGSPRLLDKFKHRIIISDIVGKSRWSDVNSSDLIFFNSEMLNVASTPRFSPSRIEVEQVTKDMERRRIYDSKVTKTASNEESSVSSTLRCCSVDDIEGQVVSRSLDKTEKRSMSEITNVSRFRESSSMFLGSNGKDERLRNIWLPMATRTARWFASRETNSSEART